MNKKLLILLALLALLCSCAKKNVSTTGSDAKEYLQLWMDKYHPGVAANADGIYILEVCRKRPSIPRTANTDRA